ncbi:hypothetical protein CDD80_7172 [Ophiocordyceps camponoti-rufipedis]|uniref:Uncharacterized protein n=1 Tax=Ophiocordyceps camponoti-rufipedis TaxID=2004952 RepID=A0A2C5YPN3_9HYPO|nr:hypothetical protein CDD80_7172 [Ophiocordyceps camponoti-rufipedis]
MSYVNIFQLAQACRGRFEFQLTRFDRATEVELLEKYQQRFTRWIRVLHVFNENNGIDFCLRKDLVLHDLVLRSLDALHVELQQKKLLSGLHCLVPVIQVSIDQRVAIGVIYDWGMTNAGRSSIMMSQKAVIIDALRQNNDVHYPRAIEERPLVCSIPTTINPYIRISMSRAVKNFIFQDFKLARICDDSQGGAFHLIVNDERELEIQSREMERIASLPTMRPFVGNPRYSRLVQHVVAYKYLESLQGPLHVPFLLQFLAGFVPMGNNTAKLRVSNKGSTPLYLTVLNFTPQWEVIVLKRLAMSIDKELSVVLGSKVAEPLRARGVLKCHDVAKAFVTSKPIEHLPDAILPPISLDEDAEVCAIGNEFYAWLNDLHHQLACQSWWCGSYDDWIRWTGIMTASMTWAAQPPFLIPFSPPISISF